MGNTTNGTPGRDQTDPPGVVNEILADYKKQRDESSKRIALAAAEASRKTPYKKIVLLVSLPVLIGLSTWNYIRFSKEPTIVTMEEEVQSVQFSIFLAVEGIENHRDTTGQLPDDLAMIHLDDEMITYQIHGSSYTLEASLDGMAVTYTDGDDLSPFMNAFDGLIAGEIK